MSVAFPRKFWLGNISESFVNNFHVHLVFKGESEFTSTSGKVWRRREWAPEGVTGEHLAHLSPSWP